MEHEWYKCFINKNIVGKITDKLINIKGKIVLIINIFSYKIIYFI